MPTEDTSSAEEQRIDRRAYLAALSATATAGLAGCGGDGGDGGSDGGSGDGELGERVGAINMISFSGVPGSAQVEQTSGYIADLLTEELGVETSVEVKEFLTFFDDLFNNRRTQNFHMNLTPPFLEYLDPYAIMSGYYPTSAGANGRETDNQYANCDYALTVEESLRAGDREERQQLVNEALSIASEDITHINLFSGDSTSAWRTDQVEVPDPGNVGINDRNIPFMIGVEATNGDDVILGHTTPGNIDAVEWWGSVYSIGWTQTVFSGLTYYDQNFEIQPHLATDWEISDDATEFTFNLREDAVFHDGEPITSEDVKWTYEWMNEFSGQIADTSEWPYESIEAPDDHTVVVTMQAPNAAWFNAHVPLWGIFPKHQMVEAGAEEDPLNIDIGNNEIIGSGPYQIRNFQPEEVLDLEPFEDHWATPPSNLVIQAFQDENSARRAFMDGTINVVQNISTATKNQIDEQLPDVAETVVQPSITDWFLAPQHDFGPTKFQEFRLAVSQSLDRQFINEVFTEGTSEIHTKSSMLGKNHPFYPENPDEVLTTIGTPAGDVEQAKQTLRDEGWGWDGDGNLHYPPNADLEPLWPQGESPADHPDQWPCVDEIP